MDVFLLIALGTLVDQDGRTIDFGVLVLGRRMLDDRYRFGHPSQFKFFLDCIELSFRRRESHQLEFGVVEVEDCVDRHDLLDVALLDLEHLPGECAFVVAITPFFVLALSLEHFKLK